MERYLPYLMLLLCPLIHIVMMRGMGHQHQQKPAEVVVKTEEELR